jgi:hypothetical protein
LMENVLKKMDWKWIFPYQVKPKISWRHFYDFLGKILNLKSNNAELIIAFYVETDGTLNHLKLKKY